MKRNKKSSVLVKVPASTSNLGPGFDVLGLALALENRLEAAYDPDLRGLRIEIEGEGAGTLPRDSRNLAWAAMRRTLSRLRAPLGGYRLRQTNRIPLVRGLGSSASACLAGVLAADALWGRRLSRDEILEIAAGMEGHPDNVVPALLGGLCVSAATRGGIRHIRFEPPKGLRAVVCVPDFEFPTRRAREILPVRVSREDAVFNVSRTALLVGALLSGRAGLLREAMEDRLHQPYRGRLIPGLSRVIAAGLRAGAFGAALSGAGPSVFAFSRPSRAAAVGRAMAAAFRRAGVTAESRVLDFSAAGARAERR
ncbi:MAG: homoserine kinase [Elusimicrobia bacterium RIFCSPHIGHO2_01_FULL_64_10]|nr:MAG: homoserine kinase [Elusimicrobia bacterium RIFCSPHIGHO2_01_FULL_64_10]